MTNFYIFRHGQTDWNRDGRLQGHSDIPLNEVGIAQAKKLAEKIKKLNYDIVYSSDLIRAQKTCELALNSKDFQISTKLREIFIGDYEGKYHHEVEDDLKNALNGHKDYKFPNGESKFELQDRVIGFLKSVANKDNILISTHGGVLARLIEKCINYEGDTFIDNCALAHLSYDHRTHNFSFIEFL